MSRPLYESRADLAHENSVRVALEKRLGLKFEKLPKAYHVDWQALHNGATVLFAELKHRTNAREAYPEYMLSLLKWVRGKELARELRVPFHLYVRWRDGPVMQYVVDERPVRYGFGGRWDRGDEQDMEPCVYIPIVNFINVPTVRPRPKFDDE